MLGAPVWLCWLVCFFLPTSILQAEVPLWFWVVFILGIDVSHVWSTIFRTYLDAEEFRNHKRLLIIAPVACLVLFAGIANISVALFWTVLAYLALYHFIKQQFGFLQLYKAKYGFIESKKLISDKTAIYLTMLYPVFYWHINTSRDFNWFVDGDFFNLRSLLAEVPGWTTGVHDAFNLVCSTLYFLVIAYWLVEELRWHRKENLNFPWGKWVWVLTTMGNWYIGIVYFNSDLVFSLTNVVAHGIPYLVLIFFYVEKKKSIKGSVLSTWRVIAHVSWMLVFVLLLAFGEEYFWDMLIYRENNDFFESLLAYPIQALSEPFWQAFALATLSLPQVTHYVLDGFIWRANAKNPYVRQTLLS